MLPTLFRAFQIQSPMAMKPFYSNMFRGLGKTKDVITLFHAPSIPASTHAFTILKQAASQAAATSTIDQASDHSEQSKIQRDEFELEVTEEAPTEDQLRSIIEYLGGGSPSTLVKGANNISEAIKTLKTNSKAFERPVTVDWNAGRAVVGDNESEILKLVNQK